MALVETWREPTLFTEIIVDVSWRQLNKKEQPRVKEEEEEGKNFWLVISDVACSKTRFCMLGGIKAFKFK